MMEVSSKDSKEKDKVKDENPNDFDATPGDNQFSFQYYENNFRSQLLKRLYIALGYV